MSDIKNADGTYNGVAALSKLTGMSSDEVMSVWQQVQGNNALLLACDYHEFEPTPSVNGIPPARPNAYTCKHCKGQISAAFYRWHELGRRTR